MRRDRLPRKVREIVDSGRYGLPLWAEQEIQRCADHLALVKQPLCAETATLWLQRRAAGRCPVGDGCPRPEAGRIFCRHHARYNNGPETC